MIIYGASGHGKVVCDIIKSHYNNNSIIFVDDADKGDYFYGHSLFHTSKIDLSDKEIIIAIGNNKTRQKVSAQFTKYLTAIHTSAILAKSCTIGKGTVVMPNVSCNADTIVGNHAILNTACSIDHDCLIEDFAHISPNAALAGNVKIGMGAHIGIGASVIQGIKIGRFATVGAGSVVIRDVPDGATVVGVPANIIKT